MKYKPKYIKIALTTLFGILLVFSMVIYNSQTAMASTKYCNPPPNAKADEVYCYNCAGGGKQCYDPATNTCTNNARNNCDLVEAYIDPAINLLSALVGIMVVIGLITGAIQFAASAGSPQKAAKARERMINSGIALFAFAFLWAFLQFLVPGGIFH